MERLTERFSNGQAAVYGCGNNCKYDFKYCENHLEDCPTINEIYEKLAEYEDLEEQGKLLKLPCKIGDTVWILKNGKILRNHVVQTHISQTEQQTFFSCYGDCFGIEYIGKTVFLNPEQAETALQALKETEGENE